MRSPSFDEGVLFAMEHMKTVVEKRLKELEAAKNTGCGNDVSGLLHSLGNYLTGFKIECETTMMVKLLEKK